jgi:hypothetical protein
MKQKVSERISEGIHAYRDGETLLFIEEPLDNLAALDIPRTIDKKHIGLRVTFAVSKRHPRLRTALDKVMKAIETIAYDDEANIDYVEVLRVRADGLEEHATAVEIIEVQEKRQMWIND